MIKPMPQEEISKLKEAVQRRWDDKPHYPRGDDPMGGPGCMLRAQEVLSLIAAAEVAGASPAAKEAELSERVSQLEQELDAALKGNVVPFFLFWKEVEWANAAYTALVKIAVDNEEARRFLETAVPRGPATSAASASLLFLLNRGVETVREARTDHEPLDREVRE